MNRKLKIEELERYSLDEYKNQKKLPLTLVLDNVRSAYNVGSIFRTADAFAVEEILLLGVTPTPPNREISKTALGAEESVRWRGFSASDGIAYLREKNCIICALEQTTQSEKLHHMTFKKDQAYALILGNEVSGVTDQLISQADYSIEIPQFGTKHSLNVANSAAIGMWKYFVDVGV